jgi:hypothetical protein
VALDPRQAALARPTTVAVHDDGNVAGQGILLKAIENLSLGGAWGGKAIEFPHGPAQFITRQDS